MERWDDYDDDWNYYRPDQPIRIEGSLKAKSKHGATEDTGRSVDAGVQPLCPLKVGINLPTTEGAIAGFPESRRSLPQNCH